MDARLPLLVFALLLGCGPAIDDSPEDGAAATSSGNEPGATTGPGDGSTGASSASPPPPSSATSSGNVTSSAGGSSDGTDSAPPFEEAQVLGDWGCVHEGPPIFLRIEAYTSPQEVTGAACVGWNEDGVSHPVDFRPCGELSSHPQGGDAWLSLFANAEEGGETWTLSVDLVYSTADDTFEGFWTGPGSGRGPIDCMRVPPAP